MESNPPIACSLSSTDVRIRQAEWEALLSRARRREGMRLEFESDPEIRDELTRLVQLERECCPFLDLQVDETSDGALVLTAGAPPEAEPILQDLLKPATLP